MTGSVWAGLIYLASAGFSLAESQFAAILVALPRALAAPLLVRDSSHSVVAHVAPVAAIKPSLLDTRAHRSVIHEHENRNVEVLH